jgi:regulator of protease activity HflC (stomatin/prohibitin superfamily)
MEGIFPLALLFAVVVLASLGVKTVPQGTNYVIERLGKFHQVLKPGLTLIAPFIDRVRAQVSLMETVMDIPKQEVITRDNARVQTDAVMFYQIINAAQATYEIQDLTRGLMNLAMTNIRTVMGGLDLDELLSKRDEINVRLLQAIDEATSAWGVKVVRIEVLDITPPSDIVNSMGRQLKAERDRRALILEADGERQATVLRAQGELEAAKLQAEARERLAQAEAASTTMVSDAIAGGNVQALNYFVAQKYVEALKAVASAPNQKVLMLPYEATGVVGSLAGVAELVSASFKTQDVPVIHAPPPAPKPPGSAAKPTKPTKPTTPPTGSIGPTGPWGETT